MINDNNANNTDNTYNKLSITDNTNNKKEKNKEKKKGRKHPAINFRNATAIKNLLEKGISITEIAQVFAINQDTIYNHFKNDPVYFEIKKNKGLISDLERALYKRAKGYDLVEETREPVEVKTAKGKVVKRMCVTKIVTKHVPPDVGALVFALSNLQPEHWKNMRYVDQSVQGKFMMEHTTRKSIDDRYNRYRELLASRGQQSISTDIATD
jgi:hypothetical protein